MVRWHLRNQGDLLFNHSLILETCGVCTIASTGHGTQDPTKHIPSGSSWPKRAGQETQWTNTTKCVSVPLGEKEIP